MSNKIDPIIEASTLSVLMSENDSITCGIELNAEYANVSLNLERESARILGYPIDWGVHDTNVVHGDSDSPTYEEVIEENGEEMDEMPVYVSKETEVEILTLLKKSLQKQFEDEMFKDELTDDQKEIALAKIDKAIGALG